MRELGDNSKTATTFDKRLAILRALACIMVVILHVAAVNFYTFHQGWWASNVYHSFVRPSIPTFLMISGALLLPSAAPLGNFLSSRAIRIIPVLCFWTVVYAAWLAQSPHEFAALLGRALSTPVMFHLWYLYALVGLYAFAPVLAAFYRHNGESAKIYFLSMWAITAALFPTLNGAFNLGLSIDRYQLAYFERFGRLFCFGSHSLQEWRAPNRPALWLMVYFVFSTLTALSTYAISAAHGAPVKFFYHYLAVFVMLASIGFFLLFLTWGPPLERDCS